jgi:cephalosporin hydroxylase
VLVAFAHQRWRTEGLMTPLDRSPAPLTPEEFRRMHRQVNELLIRIQRICVDSRAADVRDLVGLQQEMHDLLKEMRTRVENDWNKARDAVNTLARMQTAQGLAPLFLAQRQPYKDDAELSALMGSGLLHHGSFIQKTPTLLAFYQRLLTMIQQPPQNVMEIGVKGGGSTALWKALFPGATVVGLDIKLRPWLTTEPSEDGVVYLQGDQTDVKRLREIAEQYGPFDLVIDDGSHVSAHQATTIRSLLPRVRPGGFYVVEDIHTSVKKATSRPVDYGEDIWSDFTLTVFARLRGAELPPATAGGQLARELVSRIAELIIAPQVLAIRIKDCGH